MYIRMANVCFLKLITCEANQRRRMLAQPLVQDKHLSAPVGQLLYIIGKLKECTSERWMRGAAWKCEQPMDSCVQSLNALLASSHHVCISELNEEVRMHLSRLRKFLDEYTEDKWAAPVQKPESHTMAAVRGMRPFNGLPLGQALLGMLLPLIVWWPHAKQRVWETSPI